MTGGEDYDLRRLLETLDSKAIVRAVASQDAHELHGCASFTSPFCSPNAIPTVEQGKRNDAEKRSDGEIREDIGWATVVLEPGHADRV